MCLRMLGLAGSMMSMLSGCLSPSLEPLIAVRQNVTVVSSQAPRLIWVLDNSGSMRLPLEPSLPACLAEPACGTSGHLNCSRGCPSRKQVAVDWLSKQASDGTHHSSVTYPKGFTAQAQCRSGDALVSFSSVGALADSWDSQIEGGGTPTAATLDFVVDSIAPNANTDTFVVLMTDGLPNCSPLAPMAVDAEGVAAASKRLVDVYQRLLVVGLGDDVVGSPIDENPGALTAMTIDLPALCETNADCRQGSLCVTDTKTCADRFYYVSKPSQLDAITDRLNGAIAETKACLFTTPARTLRNDSSVEIQVGGELVTNVAYRFEGLDRLRFVGSTCQRLIVDPSLSVNVTVAPD